MELIIVSYHRCCLVVKFLKLIVLVSVASYNSKEVVLTTEKQNIKAQNGSSMIPEENHNTYFTTILFDRFKLRRRVEGVCKEYVLSTDDGINVTNYFLIKHCGTYMCFMSYYQPFPINC